MNRGSIAACWLSVLTLVCTTGCQGDASSEASSTPTSLTPTSTVSSPSSETGPALPRYVSKVVGVPPSASRIVEGFGSLWVQSHRENTITRLDLHGRVIARIAAHGSQLIDLAAGAGHVWYLDSPTGRILGIDPRRNKVDVHLRIDGEEGGVFAPTEKAVWFAGTSKHLYRIDARGKITGTVALHSSGSPLWPTVVGARVFVSDPEAGRIYVVDSKTLRLVRRLRLPGDVFSSSVGFGSLWVAAMSGPLFRLDPRTGAVQAKVDVPSADVVMACGRRVWVRVSDRELAGIDPATDKIVKTYQLPAAEIPGGGFLCRPDALWVTNWSDASVWKIPTRT